MSKPNMGQIMAECDCNHIACHMRGYCMAARIEALEAKLEKAVVALREYLSPTAEPEDDGIPLLRAALAQITGETDDQHTD